MDVGIGGTFLASHDPERLMAWFEDRLGLEIKRFGDGGAATFPVGEAVAVLGIMRARSDAPPPPDGGAEREPYGRQAMMLNLRVGDLDHAVARMRRHGDAVVGPEHYEGQGRFAWVRTPDGHDIELWEP